jgi:glycosyltransferase involved in cell wall biosynthesis
MTALHEPPSGSDRLTVLHLTGARADDGGILSVLRAVQEATRDRVSHRVWVNEGFQQTRTPALELLRDRFALDESPGHARLLFRAFRAWPGLKRLLVEHPSWVVHAHTRGSFLLAAWLSRQRQVLFTQHAYARRTGMYRRVAQWPGMRTVLLTPSMARHYGIAETPGRVEIVSECAMDRWFQPALPVARPPRAGRKLRVVGLGNLVRWKRWDLLLDALERLPESVRDGVECEVWGPTPPDVDARCFESELRARVAQGRLERWVRFPGPTSNAMEALASADLFLLPSTQEPCSVALIEALALGVPALASRSGGNPDILRDGATGVLFEPDSSADLAQQLSRIVSGGVAFEAPAVIRASVAHRSASVVGAKYQDWYQRLAESRRNALSAAAAG